MTNSWQMSNAGVPRKDARMSERLRLEVTDWRTKYWHWQVSTWSNPTNPNSDFGLKFPMTEKPGQVITHLDRPKEKGEIFFTTEDHTAVHTMLLLLLERKDSNLSRYSYDHTDQYYHLITTPVILRLVSPTQYLCSPLLWWTTTLSYQKHQKGQHQEYNKTNSTRSLAHSKDDHYYYLRQQRP